MTVPTVRVGDVFSRSWGYDQTNINFYQVVAVSPSGKTLKLREISGRRTEDGSHVVPVKDSFHTDYCAKCSNHRVHHENGSVTSHKFTDVFTKRVTTGWSGGAYINWNSYSGARLYDGKPEYATPSGMGH